MPGARGCPHIASRLALMWATGGQLGLTPPRDRAKVHQGNFLRKREGVSVCLMPRTDRMKCFVYIDFSLIDDGRTVGFATGKLELPNSPEVGANIVIKPLSDAERVDARTNFLITRVSVPNRDAASNDDLSWVVTCDDNFFVSQKEIAGTVINLQRHGFVYEEI